jgi:hypothetical protein
MTSRASVSASPTSMEFPCETPGRATAAGTASAPPRVP